MRKHHPVIICLAVLLPPLVGQAQSTCFTNSQGVTLCSTPRGVINGSTNQVGNSVYRDARGNQLEFQTDQFGNASVETQSGDTVNWSNPVLGEKKNPASTPAEEDKAPSATDAATPAAGALHQ